MKKLLHQDILSSRWFQYSLIEQYANVGMDVQRAIQWKRRGDLEQSKQALWRALELIDFMVADSKNKGRLKEVLRAREFLVDHFMYDNEYKTTDEFWENYFYHFNYAAALQRGR